MPRTVSGTQPVRAVICCMVAPEAERSRVMSWDCLVAGEETAGVLTVESEAGLGAGFGRAAGEGARLAGARTAAFLAGAAGFFLRAGFLAVADLAGAVRFMLTPVPELARGVVTL